MDHEWHWSEFLLLGVGLFLFLSIWFAILKSSGFMCSEKIRQALDDSAKMVAVGLARPVSLAEQEGAFRKGLVPDMCSEEQFQESFRWERDGQQ